MIHLVITTLNKTGLPTVDSKDTIVGSIEDLPPSNYTMTETYFCRGHSFTITFDQRNVNDIPSIFSCPQCTALAVNYPETEGVAELLQWRTDECPSQAAQLEAILPHLIVT